MITTEVALHIYTDGSSFSRPRTGGLGIRFVYPSEDGETDVVEDFPFLGFKGATNNQMELRACIIALEKAQKCEALHRLSRIVLHTDSLYVVDNYKKAMFEWPRTKWYTRNGTPVLNAELWKQLVKGIKNAPKRVEILWVKGHAKNIHNRAADKLAKWSALNPSPDRVAVVDVRRKESPKTIKIDSVKRSGQRVAIRIITGEYLRVQRIYKYKYEVISKRSKYYQNIDIVYSKDTLRSGHTYLVSFTKHESNPMISKLIREMIIN